jgi:hypothetical protein
MLYTQPDIAGAVSVTLHSNSHSAKVLGDMSGPPIPNLPGYNVNFAVCTRGFIVLYTTTITLSESIHPSRMLV